MSKWLIVTMTCGLAVGCGDSTEPGDDPDALDGTDAGDAEDRAGDGHPEEGDGMEVRDGREDGEPDAEPDVEEAEADDGTDVAPGDGADGSACPVGDPCDDGDPCTEDTRCNADGVCGGGRATTCDDGNLCTDDACVPASGCVFTANTAACSDGDPCTVGDTCADGRCLPGPGTGGWYPDTDGDAFGDAGATPVCAATPPAGYVADSTDCCDERNDVNPDQLAFSATSYTCGGGATYDYDCNGLEEARYRDAGGDCRRTGTTCTTVPGWQGATTPSCGSSRSYVTGCDASCRPIVGTRTQECR